MGLAQFQSALALLYTSANARRELREDRAGFAIRHQLSEPEVNGLVGDLLDEVEGFARTLNRKRCMEAMKSFPETRRILGQHLDQWFARYATMKPLGARRSPTLDGLAFVRWLLQQNRTFSAFETDELRVELASVAMREGNARWMIRWRRIPESPGRRRLIVWWRWRGRLFRRVI